MWASVRVGRVLSHESIWFHMQAREWKRHCQAEVVELIEVDLHAV